MHVDERCRRLDGGDGVEVAAGHLFAKLEDDLVNFMIVQTAELDEPLAEATSVDDRDMLAGLEGGHDGCLRGAGARCGEEDATVTLGALRSPSVRCLFSRMTCENPVLLRCGRRIPIAPLGALSTLTPKGRASRAKAIIGNPIMLLLG